MSDRLPSDHPSIETHRVRVSAHGGRRRLEVEPDVLPDAEVVRVVLDGDTRHAAVSVPPDGETRWITGAFVSPTQARSPGDGTDRLAAWFDEHDVATGSTLHLDVIDPDFAYGLRRPGTRTVYAAVERPADSLADIARQAEERK